MWRGGRRTMRRRAGTVSGARVAQSQSRRCSGWARQADCVCGMAWWWRAGAFTTGIGGRRVTRNADSGYFNVRKRSGKWVGHVRARGVTLRTTPHAEAWRAAVALEWLLGLWCAKHGECRGCGCVACAPWLPAGAQACLGAR